MEPRPLPVSDDRPGTSAPAEAGSTQAGRADGMADIDEAAQPGGAQIEELEALKAELKRVKRKYRRATAEAQAASNDVASLTQQLGDANERLAAIERRSVVVMFKRIFAALKRLLTPRQSPKARYAEQIELVRRSHLFDADWYLATYVDVAEAGIDPAVHYVMEGGTEGRDPGPEFSSSRYLKVNRDVAGTGSNPLVHYLEHGLAEGRSAGSIGSAVPRLSVEDFGPAAPVYHGLTDDPQPVRWVRHYQLDPARAQVRIGDQSVGYQGTSEASSLEAALARFCALSGFEEVGSPAPDNGQPVASGGLALLDGWFAGQSLFQSRWKLESGSPMVIRGFQRGRDGKPRLIGEALVTSPLDIVGLPIAHPYFPIVFVVCRPDGECVGATSLLFPSLCRGGQNYAELLAQGADHGFSAVELGQRHAAALEAILTGTVAPLLDMVRVDLAGGDGTRPMFQEDCQAWLRVVLRIDLGRPIEPEGPAREEMRYLGDRASGGSATPRKRSAAAQLIVPSDSVPTIAVLVAAAAEQAAGEAASQSVSMIVVHADAAKPALAIAVPRGSAFPTGLTESAFPLSFPRIVGGRLPDGQLPAAIRTLTERGLAESELLQPISQPLPIYPPPEHARETLVAIEPSLWSLPALEAGLAALALQRSGDEVNVCMIGPVDPQRRAMVELAFTGRTTSRINVHAFVDGLTAVDVLHLGPGVILHDDRTLETFQSLLEQAASASCPVLTCTKQGKNWAVAVADAGQALRMDDTAPSALANHSEMLWRSTFPVWSQPTNLWAARPALLRNAPEEADEPHLCCTYLTASYWEAEPDQQAALCLPVARANISLRIAELVG